MIQRVRPNIVYADIEEEQIERKIFTCSLLVSDGTIGSVLPTGWFASLLLNLITYFIRSKSNTCIRLCTPTRGILAKIWVTKLLPR